MIGLSQFWLALLAAGQAAGAQIAGIVRDSAGARGPTSTCSTGSRCCSRSLDRSNLSRSSMRFRNSKSRATACPRNSVVSMGASVDGQFPDTLPTFQIAGYQHLGSPANTTADFNTSVTELADSLTWVRGRHVFKMGFDFRRARLNVVQPSSPTGLFQFTSLPGAAAEIQSAGRPRNIDLALVRRVPVGGGAAVEIRGEIVNVLNTPSLVAPNAVRELGTSAPSRPPGSPRRSAAGASFIRS